MLALALLLAGCGGSPRPQQAAVPTLPRQLAHTWASQANAIATAAQSAATCPQAQQLAASLAQDVTANSGQIPARLRTPLLDAVTNLAQGITCASPPETKPKPPKGPPGHEKHGHGHDHGQGNQGGGGD